MVPTCNKFSICILLYLIFASCVKLQSFGIQNLNIKQQNKYNYTKESQLWLFKTDGDTHQSKNNVAKSKTFCQSLAQFNVVSSTPSTRKSVEITNLKRRQYVNAYLDEILAFIRQLLSKFLLPMSLYIRLDQFIPINVSG